MTIEWGIICVYMGDEGVPPPNKPACKWGTRASLTP